MSTIYGDTPHVINGIPYPDFPKLLYSDLRAAMTVPVTVRAGYGQLPIGTLLSRNAVDGKYFPYDPYNASDKSGSVTGAEYAPGRAYLVVDSGTTSTTLYVTNDDSYKFVVGDNVHICDDTTTKEDLGAITDITRGTNGRATITVTTQTGGASFTVARFAFIAIEGFDTATGLLMKSVDTGEGSLAKGANAELLVGSAVIYGGYVKNNDASELAIGGSSSDLPGADYGQLIYIR